MSSVHCLIVFFRLACASLLVDNSDPTIDCIRDILSGFENGRESHEKLLKLGDSAFAAYELLLTDPKSVPLDIAVVLGVICDIKSDRKQFLEVTVNFLKSADHLVRRSAVDLLAEIGNEKDTSPLIALLSDEHKGVRRAAGRTLAKIGGKRDLVAMEIWLKMGDYRNDVHQLEHVKKCRDELEKRLKDAETKQKDKK